jgi:hypothetical protein
MSSLPKLTAAMLHPQAEGRWLDIFQYLCPGMFDEAIRSIGTHVTCPFHGGEEDFRFVKRATSKGPSTPSCGVAMCTCGVYADGFAVLHKAMGGRFIDVLKQVDSYLNGSSMPAPAPIKKATPVASKSLSADEQAALDAEILAKSKSLWSTGKTFNPEIYTYYRERGLDPRILEDLQNVRTVSSLAHWHTVDKKLTKLGSFPALLARMQNAKDELVAVHRTWLSPDRAGKAPVPKPKKLSETPDATGAAIRLFDAKGADTLGLTEGIETGIGVRQLGVGGYFDGLGKIPVWACYAERNIRNFQIPAWLLETLERIVIFADNDASGTGLAAAKAFKERMAIEHPHLVVEIKLPHVVGWDWLDVLVNL